MFSSGWNILLNKTIPKILVYSFCYCLNCLHNVSFWWCCFISGTCLWIQPKIQRGQIHHWTRSHDKGEWLGLAPLFVSIPIPHCQNCAGTVLAVKKLFVGKQNSLYCLNWQKTKKCSQFLKLISSIDHHSQVNILKARENAYLLSKWQNLSPCCNGCISMFHDTYKCYDTFF